MDVTAKKDNAGEINGVNVSMDIFDAGELLEDLKLASKKHTSTSYLVEKLEWLIGAYVRDTQQ